MKIEYVPISEIAPYARNAKKHPNRQIEQIAESIREFGFNDPIAIWKDGTIIEGHGRLEAAKMLNMDKIPIIRLDELTDDQRRAYGLVHNKLTMNSGFDIDLLTVELEDLPEIDMEQFGFEYPDLDDGEGYFGDERERTYKSVNLAEFDESRTAGFYQMPVIEAVDHIPEDLISFNYMLTSKEYEKGVHFYIDDYQFERLWNEPRKYMDRLSQFDCVLTPDWSLYMDMPIAMQIWNVYRSRLIGQMMQDEGITVIPTLSWSSRDSYEFCFDGIKPGGAVSVSTVGVMTSKEAQEIWADGMSEAIERLCPKRIIMYGSKPDFDFGDIDVKYINARSFTK